MPGWSIIVTNNMAATFILCKAQPRAQLMLIHLLCCGKSVGNPYIILTSWSSCWRIYTDMKKTNCLKGTAFCHSGWSPFRRKLGWILRYSHQRTPSNLPRAWAVWWVPALTNKFSHTTTNLSHRLRLRCFSCLRLKHRSWPKKTKA